MISGIFPPNVKQVVADDRVQALAPLVDEVMFRPGGWSSQALVRAILEADDTRLARENGILRSRIARARTLIEALSRRLLADKGRTPDRPAPKPPIPLPPPSPPPGFPAGVALSPFPAFTRKT